MSRSPLTANAKLAPPVRNQTPSAGLIALARLLARQAALEISANNQSETRFVIDEAEPAK